jgi:L-2-amino-thiazoline-4-carboxylic acid hydrolase
MSSLGFSGGEFLGEMKMADAITTEEVTAAFPRMIRASGQFYMDAAQVLIEDFGTEGERIVRHWLRRWGQWRGRELRKGHIALGLSLNMETLVRNWDSAAATYHLMETWEQEGCWHPSNVKVPVNDCGGACPVSEPWRENDFWQWGHVLCDEFHIQFVRGYHPDAVVVIPECIMKRDPACTFNFVLPANASEPEPLAPYPGQNVLKDWQRATEKEAVLSGLRRKARVTAGRIYYLWEVLSEFHPEQAEAQFEKIIDRWSENRASRLKQEKREEQWGDDVESLLLNFDHPYSITWDVETEVSPDAIDIEVSYCPFAETWGWLGGLSAMKSYCERCYSGIASNYDGYFSAEVSRCKTRGDETCHIKITNKKDLEIG